MNRVAAALLTLFALLFGGAFGQPATSHAVTLSVPSYIGIRILGSGSGPRAVVFDYSTNPSAYLSALSSNGILPPTAVSRFDDIQVSATNLIWSIYVRATPFVYAGNASGSGLTLSDLRVRRGASSGLGPAHPWMFSYASTWSFTPNWQQLARGLFPTGGWRSLGFNGWDYELRVQGDEDPGSYTTIVTYLLTSP